MQRLGLGFASLTVRAGGSHPVLCDPSLLHPVLLDRQRPPFSPVSRQRLVSFTTIINESTRADEDDCEGADPEDRNDLREHPTSSDVACSRKTLWVEPSPRELQPVAFSPSRDYAQVLEHMFEDLRRRRS